MSQTPARRSKFRRNVLAGMFVLAYLGIAWSVYWLWIHYQLLEMRPVDYLSLLLVALGVPALVRLRTWRKLLSRKSLSSAFGAAFGDAVITYLLGRALLLGINGLLDFSSPEIFATTVTDVSCGRSSSYMLRGGGDLPTQNHTATLDLFLGCGSVHIGDSVLLAVRPGLFRQPWIAEFQVHPADDAAQQALQRHRAPVQELRLRAQQAKKP